MMSAFAPVTYQPRTRQTGRDAELMVRTHLPLVRRVAWHVHGSMSTLVDVEDLVQVGLVALIEAAASFEDRGGAGELKAYLATRLRGAMIDELRRQATTTRGAMRRRRQYRDAAAALSARGEASDDAAIARALGVTRERLDAEYKADPVRFEPIDDLYADDLPWFADDAPSAFDSLAEDRQRAALAAAIAALPEREAQVIQLYYLEDLNLEEIGQVLGVKAARVCQIKAAAHARLKAALA